MAHGRKERNKESTTNINGIRGGRTEGKGRAMDPRRMVNGRRIARNGHAKRVMVLASMRKGGFGKYKQGRIAIYGKSVDEGVEGKGDLVEGPMLERESSSANECEARVALEGVGGTKNARHVY